VVQSFIPNTLPRSDHGDCEYYCYTILTMFKLWCIGNDLKSDTESWDKSFTSHEFTKDQSEKMKYINV